MCSLFNWDMDAWNIKFSSFLLASVATSRSGDVILFDHHYTRQELYKDCAQASKMQGGHYLVVPSYDRRIKPSRLHVLSNRLV